MRLEAARDMITSASHPPSVLASKTGFGDMERMRRAFVRTVGEPPRALRRTAISERAAAGL
jgi:transcriptional regulator GlxA family with amidase domain